MKQFLQKSAFIKSIFFAFLISILFAPEVRAQDTVIDSYESIIKSESADSLSIDLLAIEDGFVRSWFYHALHTKKALNISTQLSAKLLITPASPDQRISEMKSIIQECLVEAIDLDEKYDKEVESSLLASIEDIHGEGTLNYILGGAMRGVQSDSCHKSLPFCTGTVYDFPAGVNTGNPEAGPNYGCLGYIRPNPAWYHMKIDDPGDITIKMIGTKTNGGSLDIDFALWGPFNDPVAPCTSQLTANCSNCPNNTTSPGFYPSGNLHDCSYSGASIENAHITNGQNGQYFILLIINYDNDPGNITFEKTAGTGTTDCTILPPPATNNSPVCVGETIQLNAALVGGATYQWSGPNGFISSQQNPQVPNAQYVNGGVYSLTITVDGQTSDPTTTEVTVVDPPVGTLALTGNASICKGDSTQLTVTATGPAPYTASIGTGGGVPTLVQFLTSPHTFWVKPTQNTIYTLNAITNLGCSGSTSGQAAVTVRPMPEPEFTTSTLCSGKQVTFTDQSSIASGSISSWNWNFGDGSSSSTVQNPVHVYANAGNFDISLNLTSNTNCVASLTLPVTVNPTPQVNAGDDKTIPFGTTTQLNGSASGGSGSHTYQWVPADKVDNPAVLVPTTSLLEQSTNYTLTATDLENGCQKSDAMTVTITGGPLTTNIVASPSEICIGGSTLLNATPTGGSGNYDYTWTSEPPGTNSTLQNITVQPLVSTTYKLKVYDNYTTFNAQILVVVHPLPEVGIQPVEPVLHGTTTTLSSNIISGAQPFTYVWEPGSKVVDPYASQTETTNLYQSQNFILTVTDNNGCVSGAEAEVTITGTELEVNPMTTNPVICLRDTAVLKAVPGGGSNTYVSYTWTGTDGFSSHEVAPEVSPLATTFYTVVVNDGFNTATGQVTVTVNPLPLIDLIPYDDPQVQNLGNGQIGICVYDTVTLDAGNPGQEYIWSNGSSDQSIKISTSGLSFDEQYYQVTVTNIETGCADDSEITAYFTFQNCSYGVDELQHDNRMIVYPNPSRDGKFNVILSDLKGELSLEVYSMPGKRLFSQSIQLQSTSRKDISIDLSAFSAGVYFIKLFGNDDLIYKSLIIAE